MDRENLRDLRALAPDDAAREKLRLLARRPGRARPVLRRRPRVRDRARHGRAACRELLDELRAADRV